MTLHFFPLFKLADDTTQGTKPAANAHTSLDEQKQGYNRLM